MPRPIKPRIICSEPKINLFGPKGYRTTEIITLNLDEFETIRLIDYNNLTQEECAKFMRVARTTVQKIYDDARHKVANALINGKTIKINGGNYQLCSELGKGKNCNGRNCRHFNKNINS